MIRHFGFCIAATAFGVLLSLSTVSAAPVPIDLSTWTVVQYGSTNSSWVLSNSNTTATQTVNSDPAIFLSDFDITNQQIEGSLRVNPNGDDDFIGFVFGFQNRSQYYLFDWKQLDQSAFSTFAERGMSLKVVNVSGGADPTATEFWSTAGSSNITVLRHNTIPWADFTDYDFRLNFTPGLFEIEVSQGGTVLENWVVSDSTYTSGNFGFYNFSQGQVVYNGFAQEFNPPVLTSLCGPGPNPPPAPISGSTGAQGILDPANTDPTQGLVWPAGAFFAIVRMDTGEVVFLDSSGDIDPNTGEVLSGFISSATLPGVTGTPAFPDGKLNFTSIHLPPGKAAGFFNPSLSVPGPPVIILSCQDVILEETALIASLSSSFQQGDGSNQGGFSPAGFGPRSGSLSAAGSLYPPLGGGGGNGGASSDGVTQGPEGGRGGGALVIAAAQRITLNGLISVIGVTAGTGSTLIAVRLKLEQNQLVGISDQIVLGARCFQGL